MRNHCAIVLDMGNTMAVACECPFCGTVQNVVVHKRAFAAWETGTLIQTAMPSLTDTQREALMTGICDNCFPH